MNEKYNTIDRIEYLYLSFSLFVALFVLCVRVGYNLLCVTYFFFGLTWR